MRGCAGPSAPWSPAAAPQAAPRGKPRRVRAVRRTPHAAPRPAAPLRAPPRSATPRPAPRAAASPRPAAHPSRARALCTQAAAKAACRDAALAMRAAAEQADRASVAYAHGISPQHRITASCPCTSPVAMLPPAHLPPISPPYIPYHRITISHHIVTTLPPYRGRRRTSMSSSTAALPQAPSPSDMRIRTCRYVRATQKHMHRPGIARHIRPGRAYTTHAHTCMQVGLQHCVLRAALQLESRDPSFERITCAEMSASFLTY
jgi:hypothetical protein